jgi:F-type H+-transporting ATPase subunit delta
MLTGGAPKRYAQAIFEIARADGSFEAWQRDLAAMESLVTDATGRQFFGSPKVDIADKRQVAERLLAARVQPRALNLARLLIRRGRFTEIAGVAVAFAEMVREHQGVAVAEVTTAVPLDDAARAEVARRLGALVGKRIDLRTRVDESIIGGLIARIDDYLIDGSVTGQLARMRARLEGR